LENTESDQSGF